MDGSQARDSTLAVPSSPTAPQPRRAGTTAVAHRVRRHPGDVLRAVLGAAVLAAAISAHTGSDIRLGLDVSRLFNDLPRGMFEPMTVVMHLGAVAVVPAVALAARRVRLARDLVAAATLAWLLAAIMGGLTDQDRGVGLPHAALAGITGADLGFPSGHMAVAAALATGARPHLSRPARWVAWAAVALVGMASMRTDGRLAVDVLAGAALGWSTAAVLHLLLGAPGTVPSSAQVAAALREIGVQALAVAHAGGDARGSFPFVVRTNGRELFVKLIGREQRNADLLFKAWRHVAMREVEDEAPFATAKQQAEHEAYLSMLAARAGVRTPQVLTAIPAGDGQALLVQQYITGQGLDRIDGAQVDDRLLADLWAEVGQLHTAGIAHRDLRRANVLVDADGRPWLLDFGFAEAAASRLRLARDVAELLASLGCVVGADRAVRSATDALGADTLAEALPWLQRPALAAATRAELKAKPGLLVELRQRAAAAVGVDPPRLEPLTRVRPGTLLLLVTGGLAVHLLLPQVGELRQTLHSLRTVRWEWLAVGLASTAASYLAAAVAQLGAVDQALALTRSTLVQVASSFANMFTSAGMGGVGLNVRWLQHAGLDRSAAVGAVAVRTAAAVVVDGIGLLVAVTVLGDAGFKAGHVPKGWLVLVALAAALTAAGLVLWSPLGRERLVIPALRSGRELAGALRRARKAVPLLGGSAGVALSSALTLTCCLAAFHVHPPLAGIVAVYLAGAAVRSVSPAPGGLGAMEAALVAGLTAIGTATGPAIAAVLAFRLLTFWLPALPGWFTYRALRSDGTI